MTSENKRQLPVVDVDQAFPLLTTDGAAARTARPPLAATRRRRSPRAVRDVLGWRPRIQDHQGVHRGAERVVRAAHRRGARRGPPRPRGFAMQADLGGITGGQASLYWRAKSAHEQITRMLESLQPLRPDADPQDCAAFRALVADHPADRAGAGPAGGPRVPARRLRLPRLTGLRPRIDRARGVRVRFGGTVPPGDLVAAARKLVRCRRAGSSPAAGTPVDDVPGILGALRDRFGLTDDHVNTVDEEKIRTSFLTLVDLIIDLQRSWDQQRVAFGDDVGRGFLGTELILINRLLAAAAEQVDELEAVLDSALVSSRRAADHRHRPGDPAHARRPARLAAHLPHRGRPAHGAGHGPRRDHDLVHPDGPHPAEERPGQPGRPAAGRHRAGAESLLPAARRLLQPARARRMSRAPARGSRSPAVQLLEQLARNAARIGRFTGIVLFDLLVSAVHRPGGAGRRGSTFVRVEVRGLHLRPATCRRFVRSGHTRA